MIDLYFAEFHIELIEAEGGKVVTVDCAMMRELITRLRQAEKDAARYRFMRDMSDEVDVSRFFHISVSERDAEIDEAMQCNK